MESGFGKVGYGYTSEYQGDYSELIYLRSRFYSSETGRFLTRDTWEGNDNRPLSFNRWNYVEGNPTNLSDPTGMHPGKDHFKYCEYLNGDDWKYCNRIVRRFNPADETVTEIQWKMYDLGICDNTSPLEELLPHSIYKTWIHYGWWWHYLLDRTPGWWNNNGKEHIYFKDVVAFALGVELSTAAITYDELPKYAAGAFASKGSAEGFYYMIGSRESVFRRVNVALYGSPKGGDYDPKNITGFDEIYTANLDYHILLLMGSWGMNWGEKILTKRGIHRYLNAYEWGNPTPKTPQTLVDALKRGNMGSGATNVLYFSNEWKGWDETPWTISDTGSKLYSIEFVVTQKQMLNLCNNASCVNP